ncbi:MAG: leucine--tRNA ligase [Fervidicoccaceae archaeon]
MKEQKSFSDYDLEISRKWRKLWEDERLYEPEPDSSKKKFFLTAAYPYPNAPLHLGHARTYLIPDIVARYKRMRGYNVLFPMGFHFTGTPILTATESLLKRDEGLLREYRELYEVSDEEIEKIKTPLDLATYFKRRAENDMKDYLLSIDWRREFTTVDEEYKSFIRWQFSKLREKNYIVRGTHPVGWCPLHQMPVGMHDTKGDVEPEIEELFLIHFQAVDGTIFPAATLRPETVFGAVNIWVNPNSTYVIAAIDERKMLLSKEAYRKISFQKKNVNPPERELKGKELAGTYVKNPMTGKRIPVIPASFVDEGFGTGVVMSVPAHAPYDFVSLLELKKEAVRSEANSDFSNIEPIKVIHLRGYSDIPARDIVVSMNIESTNQKELLDKATKELYLKEFNEGIMDPSIGKIPEDEESKRFASSIAGMPVKEARRIVVEFLKKRGSADTFYEIANRPVYCRCGTEIVVKILENQWFIDYENEEWKSIVRRALNEMVEIIPPEYKSWFLNVVDWLKKRACARSRGMGTPLPWDDKWIIESLSDSTIYMAFYTVISKIRGLGIRPELLDGEFWDYVFLGKGNSEKLSEKLGISLNALQSIRNEFLYWYPLDNRHSGKDLVPNHLTFMIFNHAAIFPEKLWPKRIIVNGHIMVEGEKMSKSLGNFIPLFRAIREVGPNSLRLILTYSAEIGNDANYSRELIPIVQDRLRRISELIEVISSNNAEEEEEDIADKWLKSMMRRRIINATESMEKYAFRDASIEIYFKLEQDIRRYISIKSSPNWRVLKSIAEEWVKMMSPITPAFAEEMWHLLGKNSSVTVEEWPSPEKMDYHPQEEVLFTMINRIENDVENIRKALKKEPSEVVVVVSSSDKWAVIQKLFAMLHSGAQMRDLMKEIARLNLGARPQETSEYIYELFQSLPEDLRKFLMHSNIDEAETLKSASYILEKELGLKVRIIRETEIEAQELIRRRRPIPFRPTISFIF